MSGNYEVVDNCGDHMYSS